MLLCVLWIVAIKNAAPEKNTVPKAASSGGKAGMKKKTKGVKRIQKSIKCSKVHGQAQATKWVNDAGCHCASFIQMMRDAVCVDFTMTSTCCGKLQ